MRNFYVHLFLLLSFSATAGAHVTFTPELKKAFYHIVEMRFEEARKLVKSERHKQPENRATDYLFTAMTCMELFVNEDNLAYEDQQESIDEAIERLEDLPDTEPYRNLFLGEIYTAQAILNGKFKNVLTAAWQFYKAYGFLTENHRAFPDFKPTYIPLGVLYAGIGSLPEEYRSMASLLGFEGSVAQGMLMLRRAYTDISGNPELQFYRPYAGFVYSYVDYQLGADPSLSPEKLGLEVESSSFLIYLQALYEVQQGKPAKAAQWLESRPQGDQYLKFNYLYYLHGKILLGLNPAKAKRQLETYLQRNGSDPYVKSAYRYLSWYYLLEGRKDKAAEMRNMVYRHGSLNTGADRQAMQENQHPLNAVLIESRILFDAARYGQALDILQENEQSRCCGSPREEVEYFYRMGRIYESLEKPGEAATAFEKVMTVENASPSYALGNSALQLGLLYEQRADAEKARNWYKRSLRISKYPFYEGVHQKAKAGLSRLRH